MQTSYNNTQLQFAGFFVRFAAFLIDTICVGIVLVLMRWTITSFFSMVDIDVAGTAILFEYSFLDISIYLLQALYFVVCTYLTGTTLGKKMFNLRVVHVTGEKVSLFSVIYRETIGRFLSGLFWSLGYIVVGIDKEKRGIHDFLGDTRVVYTMKFAPVAQPVLEVPPTILTESPIMPPTTSTESPVVPSTITTESPVIPPMTSTESPVVPPTISTESPVVPPTITTESPVIPPTTSIESPVVPPTISIVSPMVSPTISVEPQEAVTQQEELAETESEHTDETR